MEPIDRQGVDGGDGCVPSAAITNLESEKQKIWLSERESLCDFINKYCVKRVPKGSKELPSLEGGGFYIWQFYLRAALLRPEFLRFIALRFWDLFRDDYCRQPFQLAGVEQASLPLLTAIILASGLGVNAFTIRKERKTYGLRNIIEGRPVNLPVVFIDDLTSPEHNAFWHAVYALSSHGLRLYPRGFVLVRKQEKNKSAVINTSIGNVAIESIFTLDDFTLTYEDYRQLSV